MVYPVATSAVFALFLSLSPVYSRQITVINSCSQTVWPGLFTGGTDAPSQETGWEMPSGSKTVFQVSDNWTAGRIWARTGCETVSDRLECLTGACGGNGLACQGAGEPPATLAEFTLASNGADHYDISLVDGFNVPMNIYPSDTSCKAPTCEVNINALCPTALRAGMDAGGRNLGCLTACTAGLGQTADGNKACCSGSFNDAEKCAICGVDYYDLFKDSCKDAYAYAYDEKSGTALWTCLSAPDYTVEFCPSSSDFSGNTDGSTQYAAQGPNCPGGWGGGMTTLVSNSPPVVDPTTKGGSSSSVQTSTTGIQTSSGDLQTSSAEVEDPTLETQNSIIEDSLTLTRTVESADPKPTSRTAGGGWGGKTRTRFGNAGAAWATAQTPSAPEQSFPVDGEDLPGEPTSKDRCLRKGRARR